MRGAYQAAIALCAWNANPDAPQAAVPSARPEEIFPHAAADGGLPPAWFGWGTKWEIPTDCLPEFVGHYRGVYVWVPEHGREQLAQLTLSILDFAITPLPQKRQKDVLYFLDEGGQPTTQDKAVRQIRAAVPIDAPSSSVISADAAGVSAQSMDLGPAPLNRETLFAPQPAPISPSEDVLLLQQRLQAVEPRQ